MKRIITTLIIAIFSQVSIAQFKNLFSKDLYRQGTKYAGYVVLESGDTLNGFIKAKDPVAMEKTVHFYETEKQKKPTKKYKPADLKGYKIAHLNYLKMAYSGGLMAKPKRFVLVEKDGAIKRCIWYDLDETKILAAQYKGQSDEDYFNMKYPSKSVYYKEGEKPLEHQMILLGFAKKFSKFTADYASLSSKIKNKEKGYKALNVYKIIDDYNTWAENQ